MLEMVKLKCQEMAGQVFLTLIMEHNLLKTTPRENKYQFESDIYFSSKKREIVYPHSSIETFILKRTEVSNLIIFALLAYSLHKNVYNIKLAVVLHLFGKKFDSVTALIHNKSG